ncbi:MAG: NAD(P)H-hydrate dehydratase [Alphaproteobacteria bacterium]
MANEAAVLRVEQMYRADAYAIAAGTPGAVLMENAGRAVAEAIRRRWPPRSVVVLCGPGNNGGDGFVVARLLAAAGWPVRLALLGSRGALKGDAATAAARWDGPVSVLESGVVDGAELVVDALFGAGLTRPVEGPAAATLAAARDRSLPVAAVDVPSGLDGDTGTVRGTAIAAELTVTFFRTKPAHLLYPGRALCGELVVADIGIPSAALDAVGVDTWRNVPALWAADLPWPTHASHKYTRGHVLIAGGAKRTGAARLAARAAMRAGAGLVSVAVDPSVEAVYAAALPGALIETAASASAFRDLLADRRRNAVLLGPGGGVDGPMRTRVLDALGAERPVVLDADALTVFADDPAVLFAAAAGTVCVCTPHDGEVRRLFPALAGDRLARARAAARKSGAIFVLKGPDTVIAAPDGRAAINADAPPTLATGGTGDVLAGLIAGLLAQGMQSFAASSAAVWLHSAAAAAFGPGLIAEDLPEMLPRIFAQLQPNRKPGSTQR